jgi:putative DNA primase/helicase
VSLSRITDQQRKTEDELWKGFEVAKPKILGALLDAVSCGLKNFENTRLESMPRMADFAKRVVAAEPKLPWKPGEFNEVYQANREESAMTSFESNVVAMALKQFIEGKNEWQGTTTELKQELEGSHYNEEFINDKYWPKNPSQLSNRIRRISPSLRAAGISVEEKKVRGQRLWTFFLSNEEGVGD